MNRIAILQPGSDDPFPAVSRALREPDGLLAIGGDLSPQRLLDAYRHGIFPWYAEGEPILWWTPDPRMVFATDALHVSARLRRWIRHCPWTVSADTAFEQVMRSCALPRAGQHGTWITDAMVEGFARLHRMGCAHSVEVYEAGRLVGGIYGVAIGRMFFGESMFSRKTNASKLALVALCRTLCEWGFPLLDAQVRSAHLESLGAFTIPRREFLDKVAHLAALEGTPGAWTRRWPIRHAVDVLPAAPG